MKKVLVIALLAFLISCSVGPDYKKPTAEKPVAFKEGLNWKQATPQDETTRGNWWEVFKDPELNKLEEQIAISNQNVKAAAAQFRSARALIAQARSAYFPTVSGSASASRFESASGASSGLSAGFAGSIKDRYGLSLSATWELDAWGRIRRTVESNKAGAQASAADLASALLSAQSQLAIAYLNLRMNDKQKQLLDDIVAAYAKAYELNKNQYDSGIINKSALLQAQTQLETAKAQAMDAGIARAQYEHAIAILIGKAPADFAIVPNTNLVLEVPAVPAGIPSELLERRPDIAAAERRVAAANAKIGIAKAAYFPTLSLGVSGGYQSSGFSDLISLPNRLWSIGPTLAETIFDGGLRRSQSEVAIANYDQSVAAYRQAVLNGFGEVEDNIAALRILEQETEARTAAVEASRDAKKIFLNQYNEGIVSYLSVATAQTTELNNELSALVVKRQRLTAAATLVKALGGGWNVTELAKSGVTKPETTPLSVFPVSKSKSVNSKN